MSALKLDVIVVGAGLAGLAAACALAVNGHRVRMFEKSPGTPSVAGGIRLPPNAVRILEYLGMQDELSERSSPVTNVALRDLRTGELIGNAVWLPVLFKDSGSEARVIDHRDLCDMLCKRSISAGANVSFNSTVASVSPPSTHAAPSGFDGRRPSVALHSGEIIHADLIIGADGARGVVRPVVDAQNPRSPWKGAYTGTTVYTGVCAAEHVEPEESGHEVDVWMSEGFHAMSYGTGRKEYVLHMERIEDLVDDQVDEWGTVPASSIPLGYEFAPRIERMLKCISSFARARCYEPSPADEWVDASGTIILTGHAAHPMLPDALHQSSNCLESAAVLSTLLSHLRTRDQLVSLLYAYHDLRAPRAAWLHELELKHRRVKTLAGDLRMARDADMRAAFVKADSSQSCEEAREALNGHEDDDGEVQARRFAAVMEGWGYDAREEAEEWWVRWGLLKERASMREHTGEHSRPGDESGLGGVQFAKHTIKHV